MMMIITYMIEGRNCFTFSKGTETDRREGGARERTERELDLGAWWKEQRRSKFDRTYVWEVRRYGDDWK
jgi:hypothetical protein